MTINALGPAWIQLNYTSNAHAHKALLPCTISGSIVPGTEPSINRRSGTPSLASAVVAEYVNLVIPFLSSASSVDSYEVFSRPTLSDPITLVWADSIGTVGTGSGATVVASEILLTFKTALPGGLKLYIMEGEFQINYRAALASVGASPQKNLSDYVLGSTNWIVGRNGGFPLAALYITTKMNDHLRRRYVI